MRLWSHISCGALQGLHKKECPKKVCGGGSTHMLYPYCSPGPEVAIPRADGHIGCTPFPPALSCPNSQSSSPGELLWEEPFFLRWIFLGKSVLRVVPEHWADMVWLEAVLRLGQTACVIIARVSQSAGGLLVTQLFGILLL